MKKLAIITTHPIQYYAPVFKLLCERGRINVKVFYTLGETAVHGKDPGFGHPVKWDLPLTEGYPYQWLKNNSDQPGTGHFAGIDNPVAIELIDAYTPDAVLVFGWANRSHLRIIRHFSGKLPVYFRGDSTILNEAGGLKRMFRYIFLKWVYRHINHAFYVGTNNKAYFGRFGLQPGQLSFAPHAVDNHRFETNRQSEAQELRASLGLCENDILLLFAGKFEPVKNIGLLLAAFKKLDRPHVHLLLAGDGAEREALQVLAGTDNIHFTGFTNQTQMPVLYQAADIFCLPSKSETWGLSINEAMACGKAILASDRVGCAADLVTAGNGAVFKNNNEADLLEKLQSLTLDKAELVNFGLQSKRLISDWNFLSVAMAIEQKLLNEG